MTPYGSQSAKVSGLHVSIQSLQTGEHLSLGIVDNVSIDFYTATMKRKRKKIQTQQQLHKSSTKIFTSA